MKDKLQEIIDRLTPTLKHCGDSKYVGVSTITLKQLVSSAESLLEAVTALELIQKDSIDHLASKHSERTLAQIGKRFTAKKEGA